MAKSEMKFKVGDVVKLRSGGPKMTINGSANDSFHQTGWKCAWFKGGVLAEGEFSEEALIIAPNGEAQG